MYVIQGASQSVYNQFTLSLAISKFSFPIKSLRRNCTITPTKKSIGTLAALERVNVPTQ